MTDLFQYPTLLRAPTWYGGEPDESPLHLPADSYEVLHDGDRTTVRVRTSGEVVYNGIGPASVAAAAE